MPEPERLPPKRPALAVPDLTKMTQEQAQTLWQRTMQLFAAKIEESGIQVPHMNPEANFLILSENGSSSLNPVLNGIARAIKYRAEHQRQGDDKMWLVTIHEEPELWNSLCRGEKGASGPLLAESIRQAALEIIKPGPDLRRTGNAKAK